MTQTTLTPDYVDNFNCMYCFSPALAKCKTPRGKQKFDNQEYLFCLKCNKIQMRLTNVIKND